MKLVKEQRQLEKRVVNSLEKRQTWSQECGNSFGKTSKIEPKMCQNGPKMVPGAPRGIKKSLKITKERPGALVFGVLVAF